MRRVLRRSGKGGGGEGKRDYSLLRHAVTISSTHSCLAKQGLEKDRRRRGGEYFQQRGKIQVCKMDLIREDKAEGACSRPLSFNNGVNNARL